MPRGGKNYPARPAPVSGPGKLSRRTDGGAGSKSQPIRTPTGGDYGAATQIREAQQAVPLEAAPSTAVGAGGAPSSPTTAPPSAPPVPGGVFGPTERPNEPPTAGIAGAQTPVPNTDDALRALYSVFPHPQLLQLISRG
jgi:hypothetical protein